MILYQCINVRNIKYAFKNNISKKVIFLKMSVHDINKVFMLYCEYLCGKCELHALKNWVSTYSYRN